MSSQPRARARSPHVQPHDGLVKWTFSQKSHAASLLKAALPQEVVVAIDWGSLRVEKDSFIDRSLRKRHTDLLWSAKVRGERVFFYALIEHQREVELLMIFRFGQYLWRAWDRLIRDKPTLKKLPPIVPLLLHNGTSGWSAATAFQDIVAGEGPARSFGYPRSLARPKNRRPTDERRRQAVSGGHCGFRGLCKTERDRRGKARGARRNTSRPACRAIWKSPRSGGDESPSRRRSVSLPLDTARADSNHACRGSGRTFPSTAVVPRVKSPAGLLAPLTRRASHTPALSFVSWGSAPHPPRLRAASSARRNSTRAKLLKSGTSPLDP
ncbi:MAG: Rpn family recombination-promoting nuclease/putative transposase [Polyangiaceae bacterium]|nr:Rpn family recombination-promoting nuclease/putative transposase [Polyangiaceae bacterium]